MKKHLFILASIMLLAVSTSWADFHFSQVAPSGQTLYFNITDSAALTVAVTCPGYSSSTSYTGYSKPTGNLVIPSTVTYNDTTYTVTAIGSYAFFSCDSIIGLELPASVTSIDTGAFAYCYGLSGWEIPSTVTYIMKNSFNNVRNLHYYGTAANSPWGALGVNAYYEEPFTYADSTKTLLLGFDVWAPYTTIPASVTALGNYAFSSCQELDSVVLPSTITDFGALTFFDSKVKKVVFPEGMLFIPDGIFTSCRELVEVYIPSTVTRIEGGAFMDCRALPNIVVPNSVTYIGEYAFCICMGLQTITLGRSVDSIGNDAFDMCMALSEINSLNPVAPTLGDNVFMMVPATAVINIPCGSTESYDSIWGSVFTNFVEVSPVVTVLSDNDSQGYAEVIVEPSCANPFATIQATANQDYVFLHWSDGSTDNPYSFEVTSDTTMTAYFGSIEGINDINNAQWNVTANGNTITINGVSNRHVRIFDSLGRLIYSETMGVENVTVQVPNTGVYMIQVDNSPVKRVVAIN